jgi:hypothetical protein
MKQLFALKGNYSEGFGQEKPTAKWTKSDANSNNENNTLSSENKEKEPKPKEKVVPPTNVPSKASEPPDDFLGVVAQRQAERADRLKSSETEIDFRKVLKKKEDKPDPKPEAPTSEPAPTKTTDSPTTRPKSTSLTQPVQQQQEKRTSVKMEAPIKENTKTDTKVIPSEPPKVTTPSAEPAKVEPQKQPEAKPTTRSLPQPAKKPQQDTPPKTVDIFAESSTKPAAVSNSSSSEPSPDDILAQVQSTLSTQKKASKKNTNSLLFGEAALFKEENTDRSSGLFG